MDRSTVAGIREEIETFTQRYPWRMAVSLDRGQARTLIDTLARQDTGLAALRARLAESETREQALVAALERYRDPANWAQVTVNGAVWTVWRDGEPTHEAEQALAGQPAAREGEGT